MRMMEREVRQARYFISQGAIRTVWWETACRNVSNIDQRQYFAHLSGSYALLNESSPQDTSVSALEADGGL